MRVLTSSALLEACRAARRFGEATGNRVGNLSPAEIWPPLRDVLGLPSDLDPEQSRHVFECFATSHRSSGAMKVAVPFEADPQGHKKTQVFRSRQEALRSVEVFTLPEPFPEDNEPVETPLRATARLFRSLRQWFRPPPDESAIKFKTAVIALYLETQRHMARVREIAADLEERR